MATYYPNLHTYWKNAVLSVCVSVCVRARACVKKHLVSPNVVFCHVCSLQRCSGSHSLLSLSFCPPISDVTRHQVCAGGLWEAVQTNHWPGFLSKENKPSRWDTFVIFQESPSFRDPVQTCVLHTDKRLNAYLLDKWKHGGDALHKALLADRLSSLFVMTEKTNQRCVVLLSQLEGPKVWC